MGYAYSWLPENQREKLSDMEFFYGANKIVSVFYGYPNDLIIEYKKLGSQTYVIHGKRGMMFDANFVDVFCEDLKLLIHYQKCRIYDLEVLYQSDCRVKGVFDDTSDDVYDEEILDPIIKKIFDTLETSIKSRRFPFSVRDVRVAPAALDEGLSLVNLFQKKELECFEFHFEKRETAVDLGSLVPFQTSNRQYRNRITVYLDVITQDQWVLLQKRFTPDYYHIHRSRSHVNQVSVSSVSREVACQVLENPIIMERITEHFQLFDIIRLRRVSNGVRNCVDDVTPDPHIKSYSLMFQMFLPKKEHDPEHMAEKRRTTDMYIELINDESRSTSYEWKCTPDLWPPSNDFNVNALFEEALDDFEANVKHQKTTLEELRIVYWYEDEKHKSYATLRSEKLAERIAELLSRRRKPLKVQKLSIGAKHPWEVTSILSNIDKDSLKTIQFLKTTRKKGHSWEPRRDITFDMGDMSSVEQWMRAEEFICTDVILTTPIQQANITHFAKVDIVVDTISSEDVFFLKTELLNSAALQKFKITFKKSTIDETLRDLIGEPYRDIPNVKKIWLFRGQTDPDYYLHLILETHNLSDKTRKLVLSRVKKEDTPFFQIEDVKSSKDDCDCAKLIREGKYSDFLVKQNAARTEQLSSGSQPFIDYMDDFYLGNVTVGTPAQTVTLVLDTGSSNLWVIDAACTTEACNGDPKSGYPKHKFDTKASSTFISETRKFSISYGSGSCSGHLGKDTITMGGLTVKNQEFGVAENLASVFAEQPVDGILGLGWPALAEDKVVPPMQNLLPQLDLPLFTVWLDRKLQGSNGGNGGLITYGALDTVNCDSKINYVPLTAKTYWEFELDGFAVGTFSETKGAKVISDTGTSWIGAPHSIISAVVKATGAKFEWTTELYVVPCSTMQTQPDIIFTIGGIQYNVKSVEYILDLGLGKGNCALTFFGMTYMGFGPSWILGDTFIRQYCNVYDIGNEKIGFALAKHSF